MDIGFDHEDSKYRTEEIPLDDLNGYDDDEYDDTLTHTIILMEKHLS